MIPKFIWPLRTAHDVEFQVDEVWPRNESAWST